LSSPLQPVISSAPPSANTTGKNPNLIWSGVLSRQCSPARHLGADAKSPARREPISVRFGFDASSRPWRPTDDT
jgi:hypothetical protein